MDMVKKRSTFLLAVLMFVFAIFPAAMIRAEGSEKVTLHWDTQNETSFTVGGSPVQWKLWDGDASSSKADVTGNAEWQSSQTDIVTVSNGLITPVGKGSAVITATWKDVSVTKVVNVKSRYTKLELDPSGHIDLLTGGDSKQLTVKGTVAGGTTETVSGAEWASSNTDVAVVEDGLVQPRHKGVTYIAVRKDGLRAQVVVYVRSSSQALLLSESGSLSMYLGSTPVQLKATDVNLSGIKTDVTARAAWTSSDPLVLTVEQGALTAKAAGKTNVAASYQGFTKVLKVTVMPGMEKLAASKESLDLETGGKTALPKILAYLADSSKKDVSSQIEWSVGNQSVAKIVNDKVVAVSTGSTTLTASLGSLKVTIPVTVQYKVLKLMASTNKYTMVAGQESALPTVTATLAGGGTMDVSSKVSWVATTAAVTISNSRVKAVSSGTSGVKAMYLGKYIKVPVNVEATISTVTPNFTSAQMNLKTSKPVKVTGLYPNGKKAVLGSKMNWTTSNASVAVMKGSSIKAVGIGSATITGTYQDKKITISVTVSPKLLKLVLDAKNLKLITGSTQVLNVKALYDTGVATTVTSNAQWTSTKPTVAQVNGGLVKAVANGTTTVKATYNGKTITTSVKVSK